MGKSAPIVVTSHCFLHASGPGIVCVQELHTALKRVQNELAKYSHVNKKALDQYVNFTEQRENLDRRRQEIEESGGSIPQPGRSLHVSTQLVSCQARHVAGDGASIASAQVQVQQICTYQHS